jgi:hypothetical protein
MGNWMDTEILSYSLPACFIFTFTVAKSYIQKVCRRQKRLLQRSFFHSNCNQYSQNPSLQLSKIFHNSLEFSVSFLKLPKINRSQ